MSTNFEQIMRQARASHCKRLAVACAQDGPVLQAVSHARRMGIAEAILVGDAEAISRVASAEGIDISGMTVVDEPDDYTAALRAVAMVRRGDADMYMKGIIDTRSFLRSVLDQECGLRTGRMMSHVVVMDLPSAGRLLLLTDVAFNPAPTLDEKCRLIENAVEVANACGLTMPRVAPLAAVEVVNPKMPCTVEADRLTQMNLAGQIGGCIVDGPLSLDLAIDPEAARHKHAEHRRIAGNADILLFPDIQAGNITYKCLVHTTDCRCGCILTGTAAPVILTSRSDDVRTKVNSIALAAVVAGHHGRLLQPAAPTCLQAI